MAIFTRFFIGGAWVPSEGGAREAVINPANEEEIGAVPAGTVADCDRAIAAARRAFDDGPWPGAARHNRAHAMRRLYDAIEHQKARIVDLMRIEMGYTPTQCEFQYRLAMTQLNKFVELAGRDTTKSLPILISPSPAGGKVLGGAITARDPIGVVAAITPYNAGFLLGVMKAAPAMAAGNTVVLKPSPYTPLQSFLLAEIVAGLDLPPGVFNVITGGADVGALMSADPRIDMISFTGSDAVGAHVMANAAPTLKKVHLELGGKSPLVIRHDADFARAIPAALYGFVFQAGQGCSMTTRMLVDNRIRPAFVEALAAAVKDVKVGDPAAPGTVMGPLIRETARQRTEGFVRRALDDGARLVCGGRRPAHLTRGFYFEPTVFDDVRNESHLAQNEVFGPIAAIVGFDSDEEAIKLANQSAYGLGGAIISRDTGTAMEMALRIRTGTIMINNGPGGFHPDMPFGGYKRSGLGREWGEEGYYEYTEIKAIGFPAGQ